MNGDDACINIRINIGYRKRVNLQTLPIDIYILYILSAYRRYLDFDREKSENVSCSETFEKKKRKKKFL